MNRCQSFESVIHGKDATDVLLTAPPDSKNIAQWLGLGTRDNSAKRKTNFATRVGHFCPADLSTYARTV